MTASPTPSEQAVLCALASAWNAFLDLPVEHPDDQTDFRQVIHRAQLMIMARPTRRLLCGKAVDDR